MNLIRMYIKIIDYISFYSGKIISYFIYVLMFVLLYSSFTKTFFIPPLWSLEIAQFIMAAYYLVGGAYSLQSGAHVRMDLLYGSWSKKTKLRVDIITILFLIFYLLILLYGAISSTSYALEYSERSYSSWRPYMSPIKLIMCFGIVLMLLQSVSILLKDILILKGKKI